MNDSLEILAWYVERIMEKHGTYCTVQVQPKFDDDLRQYNGGISITTYISGLPSGVMSHVKHDSYESAGERLRDYLNCNPLEKYEELREEKIIDIKNEIDYLQEQLRELGEE